MLKWIALAAVMTGLVLARRALKRAPSVEDGSIVKGVAMLVGGAVLFAGGVLTLIVLAFNAL